MVSWHRAGIDVVWFRATEAALVVSATVKVPIGLKQRAGRGGTQTPRDIRPGCTAMFSNVAAGNLVRDALKVERAQQPIEYLGRVALGNGFKDTGFLHITADII
jgi:hypothetical protein